MNSVLNRFGPPAIVFGAALYLGWPPAAPLDLGESVVKAKAVRWKKNDLAEPPSPGVIVDPFRQVLVANGKQGVESETGKLVPTTKPAGPSPAVIRESFQINGIASMAGSSWAIVNGKPRVEGDLIETNDAESHSCRIKSIASDHVVVVCDETEVTLRPKPFGSQSRTSAKQSTKKSTGPDPATSIPLPSAASEMVVPLPPTIVQSPQA